MIVPFVIGLGLILLLVVVGTWAHEGREREATERQRELLEQERRSWRR